MRYYEFIIERKKKSSKKSKSKRRAKTIPYYGGVWFGFGSHSEDSGGEGAGVEETKYK